MLNSIDELLEDIKEWDLDKCVVIEKMVNACPGHLRGYVNEPNRLFKDGGVIHKSIQYYLYRYFKDKENEDGKDVS